jgi:hypothetical protein
MWRPCAVVDAPSLEINFKTRVTTVSTSRKLRGANAMEVLLLDEDEVRTGSMRLPLLLLTLAMLAFAVAIWSHLRAGQTGSAAAAVRATGPSGMLVPSPNDPAWTDYYRSHKEGVEMAVHMPGTRKGDGVVVWEKYHDQAKGVIALAEVHYDCPAQTRRSARMAIYRNGSLNGVADMPNSGTSVPVAAGSVEFDALELACRGKIPDTIDED